MSLLTRARELKVKGRPVHPYTKEEFELIEAWVKDEVTLSQLAHAKEFSSPNAAYSFIAIGLKQMLNGRKLK